jgi:DNA-binding IclR family transcriptional regulator
MAREKHKNHDIYFVPGLRRGLLVLETLAAEGRPMGVADIGRRIGLSRSSMFRLAYTLQHMGFVEEVPETKALKLGARVLNIGYAYLASQTLIEIARPELEALRDRTSVSSHLAILDRGEILYLSCIQTKSGFLSTMNVGTRLPAYATPMGWLLLTGRTAAQIAELYPERSYTRLTDQTPRNAAELARRISTCNSIHATAETIAQAAAIGIVPARLMAEAIERGVVRQLKVNPSLPGHQVAICYQIREFGPGLKVLVDLIRELVDKHKLFV